MSSAPSPDKDTAIRTMQIIAGALMLGVVAFGGVVGMLLAGRAADDSSAQIISYVAAGASLLALVVVASVPASLGQSVDPDAPAEAKERARCGAYQTRMIVRFAILEGVAMLNLVAALIEGQRFNLVIAGFMLLCMALLFPTRSRVESFIKGQSQLDDLPEMR